MEQYKYTLILVAAFHSVILHLETIGAAFEGESQDGMKCPFREMFTTLVKYNQKTGTVNITLLLLLKLFAELWGAGCYSSG